MRRGLPAIIAAWIFPCGTTFQPSTHHGPDKSSVHFFQRDGRRQHRSSWSPLFGFGDRTDAPIIAHNREYLSQTLGFSEGNLTKESRRGGSILTLEIGVLRERVDWLKHRLVLKESEMKKIAQQQPRILGRQQDTILAKLDYLQTRLLLDDNSLRKLILTAPGVLIYSIEDNIELKLDWLQERLGLDATEVSKMIQRCPAIFNCSVDDNMEPKLGWLQQRLDLDAAGVSKMVQRLPSLLNCSVNNNIEPKLEWLQRRLDLDDSAVSKMVQQLPALFCCSVDRNLEPTLDFYIDALRDKENLRDKEKAVALIVRCPALLAYSLEKRLKPRLKDAREAGIMIDSGCLSRLGMYSNEKWNTSLLFQERQLENEIAKMNADPGPGLTLTEELEYDHRKSHYQLEDPV